MYHLPATVRLEGPLDVDVLRRCLLEVHRRHDALRTVVRESGPGVGGAKGVDAVHAVHGVVDDDLALDFAQIDTPPPDEMAWLRAQACLPFDLAAGPLWRCRLLRHDAHHHVFLITLHHVIADGWSLRLLVQEVGSLYAARMRGAPSPLPPPAVAFADYAHWRHEQKVPEAALRFWHAELAAPPPPLELAIARPRPAVETPEGASIEFALPARLVDGLRALARRQGTTLFTVCLAAFQSLLHRYSGLRDLCVGVPITNRPRLELEGVIGLFVDTLVLRARIDPAASFESLVAQASERMKAAQAHQDLPFDRLVEALQPTRDTSRSPLFQAMFVYEAEELPPAPGELTMTPLLVHTGTAKFDCTLALSEVGGGLRGSVEYRTQLLPDDAMARFVDHLGALLEDAAAAPARPIERLALMRPAEAARVLDDWGGRVSPPDEAKDEAVPGEATVHDMVYAAIARSPDAIAVICGTERCRYAELGERAARLAAYLRPRGAGPGARVGVCLARTTDLVVALLAVLETGAAYVPLDPAYPEARVRMMLEDAELAVLIVPEDWAARLGDAVTGPREAARALSIVCPARDAAAIAACSARREPVAMSPDAPSHVIYTSGSTGRPKGVAIRHASTTRRLGWARRCFGDMLDGTLASTSVCFDLSVFEIFAPLSTGGRVILVDNALALAGAPAAGEVRLINTVPSAAAELCRMEALPPGVRVVNLAGEALPAELVERLYATGHVEAVYNLYGPSEDTTYSTGARIERGCAHPPIGRPLPGTTSYVLDERGQPVPAGLPGELYLGGGGLAQGYFRRPDQTAERFVPDPFRGVPGARMYRTGDRVRYRADGQLEFLGRLDHQVKIRGFRIEPGEVARVLAQHPQVKGAVVTVDRGPDGQPRLVGYVAMRPVLPDELARRPRHAFPAEALEVVFQRRSELEHFYQDIFVHRTYLRHGVTIEPGDTVVDVGANIGLFTLFAGANRPGVRVLSFEPVPTLARLVQANADLNGVDAQVFQHGLGAAEATRAMTFYPDSSGMSSFYADAEEERAVLRRVFENERLAGHADAHAVAAHTEDLIDARLRGEEVVARTRRLSDVLREQGIDRVDLLKVDVQKAELEVLTGIDDADWDRIRQLVVEVHDVAGRLAAITGDLERRGFAVTAEQDPLFAGSIMWNVYARRPAPRPPRPIRVQPLAEPPAAFAELRPWLKQQVPHYLVPAVLVPLRALPRTPNGKLDRAALPVPDPQHTSPSASYVAPRTDLERTIAAIWRERLGIPRAGIHDNFFDLGGHSLLLVATHRALCAQLGRTIPLVLLFEHPTIASLAARLESEDPGQAARDEAQRRGELRRERLRSRPRPARAPGRQGPGHERPPRSSRLVMNDEHSSSLDHAIAIVGLAGRFPGARDLPSYWEVLRAGRVCVRFFDRQALREAGVLDALADAPGYVPARAILDDAECFDAALFGVSPAEAELMDPQFRQFLECSYAALEDAGIVSGPGQRIGVFGGVGAGAYMLHLLQDRTLHEPLALFRSLIHNEKDYLTTLTSYKLDLRGPAVTVQSACSTALVAVHLACQSLLSGECDAALAGGASISYPQHAGYRYETSGFLSPDGHCRPFDADGRGTVEGNGVGVAVLRRLADALADGDPIRAVILGSAVNNDGAGRIGFTAPGVEGQIRVLAEALAMADVDPREVDFIETHGTGTQLGDPIEVTALGRVYGAAGRTPALLGAVKANIGHLGAAAGAAGLAKVVLALEHGEIPPTPNFRRANPAADLAAGPFDVPTSAVPWPERAHPRRASISAFGIGGTNAHLVLEQAPPLPPPAPTTRPCALVWSALDDARADEAGVRLAAHLEGHSELELADVAFTLQTGRRAFGHRRAVVARTLDEARQALGDPRRVRRGAVSERLRVAFLFAGLGDQYPGMARALDRDEPVFHDAFERCAKGFAEQLGIDLRAALYDAAPAPAPGPGASGGLDLRRMLGRGPEPDAPSPLRNTKLAQAAVFSVGYALAQLLVSRGVRPDAVIGHSLGEYLAAQTAGILGLDDAIALVSTRARMLGDLAPGAMLTVALGDAEVTPYLDPGVSLSAVNAPEAVTLAGDPEAIAKVHARLREAGIAARPLPADRAFHSWMMEPAVPELVKWFGRMPLRAPVIPCISNVTGDWMTPAEATDPAYWGRHLRQPVRFAAGAAALCAGEPALLVEIGAGHALGSFVRQAGLATAGVISTVRASYEEDDGRQSLEAVAAAWVAGIDVSWPALHGPGRRRVPLPSYPFARTRHVRQIELPIGAGPLASRAAPVARAQGEAQAGELQPGVPAVGSPAASPPSSPVKRTAAPVAPTNTVEEELLRMWRELLRISDIGIHDNFFELGGQSLVGVQLLSRIRQTWGVELPLRALFADPTIAGLALAIEEALVAEIENEAEGETKDEAEDEADGNDDAHDAPTPELAR